MVMYEIWSLGHKPFETWDVQEVKKEVDAACTTHWTEY